MKDVWIVRDKVRLHAMEAGETGRSAVILLHGFPEFWYGWHNQIEPLVQAGFRVIVPDGRGYNLSDKPDAVKDYRMKELVADLEAWANYAGTKPLYLAGHDWGAAVAWIAAHIHPTLSQKIAIFNVPHPAVLMRNLRTNMQQLAKSWYMFFFQLPKVPEAMMRAGNFRSLVRGLKKTSLPGTFNEADFARYREAWSQPGALTGMINWYRALFRYRSEIPESVLAMPVRIFWGERDAFIEKVLVRQSMGYCKDVQLHAFPDATHWIQHEKAEEVSRLLIQFLRE